MKYLVIPTDDGKTIWEFPQKSLQSLIDAGGLIEDGEDTYRLNPYYLYTEAQVRLLLVGGL